MSRNTRSDTKRLLANALEELLLQKPFRKISVNELCKKADISRSTFYLHFENKYDLIIYCLEVDAKDLDKLMNFQSIKDCLIVILNYFQTQRQALAHIFDTELSGELSELIYQFYNRYLTRYLEEKLAKGFLLPGPVDSVIAFYVGGLTFMLLRWIQSDYKLPKETLASCQCRLLKDIL